MSDGRDAREDSEPGLLEEHLLSVRLGHGANCSSMGSVIDTLFATAVVGAAVFAAIAAAMQKEGVCVARRDPDAAATPRRGAPSAPPGPEDAP